MMGTNINESKDSIRITVLEQDAWLYTITSPTLSYTFLRGKTDSTQGFYFPKNWLVY